MKLDGRRRTGMGLWLIALVMVLGKVAALTNDTDMAVLQAILKSVKDPTKLQWSGNDACGSTVWPHIQCSGTSVTGLQFQNLGLSGELPSNLNQLANLQAIALQGNSFSGPLPTFNGLSNLQTAYLDGNQFDTIPADFFKGLTKLQLLSLDDNPLNASTGWTIPVDLAASSSLSTLSLTNTSLSGKIPSFLGTMASLQYLKMAYNKLSGSIPTTFQNANLINLQLNNQVGSPPLSGPIDVVGSMQSLRQLWLQVNQFSGTIPPSLGLAVSLQDCRLNDNDLVGVIPSTFVNASSLTYFSVKNNHLVGPVPNIPSITIATNYSFGGTNEFCSNQTGVACPPQVSALLAFLAGVGYASDLVQSWGYNNPCAQWKGITCDAKGDVISINLPNDHLRGYISPNLANLSSLTNLILSDNNLTGTIPSTLASLKSLQKVDLSNNNLYGPVPKFTSTTPITSGNPNINKSPPPSAAPGTPPSTIITPPTSSGGSQPGGNPPVGASGPSTGVVGGGKSSSVSVGAIVGAVLGVIAFLAIGAIVALLIFKKKRQRFLRVQSPNTIVVRPGSDNNDTEVVKITVGNSVVTNGASEAHSRASSGPSDVQVVEAGNLVISIQVLRNVTNNFSEENVLGKGGFGVVYKGELDDGTKIAVKRMEASVVSNKGLSEFQAEIAVLTKVRHRHLVALLGYCVDGNERLLVYEYMPMGTLSQHLFDWGKLGLSPLSWKRRLSIALDVARGMEYLHGLAHKSFIHRDLKPSNILLGDDFRAKVSDFGLVKLAPEGKFSVETRLAGTFGYLAPEYAVTGRVTTKSDVFSFGVVLMELITGRRALDESQPEESMHLVTWFRRMSSNKEAFVKAIDRVLEVTDDSFRSICTVAELAGHCTAREPYQRPDMGHAVNVLSPLVEQWKPTDVEDDGGGIDLDMTLPQALKKWQAFEDSSVSDLDDSKVSIPTRPTGFADSFTSSDGR